VKIDIRILVGTAAIIAIAAVGYWYWNSPERRIKETLSEAEAAFEAKDIDGVMAHVSLRYRDDMGLAYLNLKELMNRGFEEFEEFDVRLGNLSLEIADDEATVLSELRLIVIQRGEKAYLLGNDQEPLPIEFQMLKETLSWKLGAINGIRVPYLEF
jgi:hypothetical protein